MEEQALRRRSFPSRRTTSTAPRQTGPSPIRRASWTVANMMANSGVGPM